jgi:hypothetical protein
MGNKIEHHFASMARVRASKKRFALLNASGTACSETVLTEREYGNLKTREREEDRALAQDCPEYDRPVAGTWTDVSENEACQP